MRNSITDLQKNLPFDQYSRQMMVSHIIETVFRKEAPSRTLKIIDIGGHKGKTVEFQSRDSVTILDVFNEDYANYVKGDATNMDFADDSFDVACSFDVLEHIPRDKRQDFINEALRVSKTGLFIALPIDTQKKVSDAEKLLNEFHKIMYDTDHRWLKEHIDYRIPTEQEVSTLVTKAGASYASVYSNQIGDWQLMQAILFAASNNNEITTDAQSINHWYNQHTIDLDAHLDIGYRGIFFISKQEKIVKSVRSAIRKIQSKNDEANLMTVNKPTFEYFMMTFAELAKKSSNNVQKNRTVSQAKKNLVEENIRLKTSLKETNAHVRKLESQLASIYGSKSWKLTIPVRKLSKVISKKRGR